MSDYVKDPDEIEDYRWSWAEHYLTTGETITAATVTADTGLTVVSSTFDTTSCTARASGGTNGQDYALRFKITTSAGRVNEQVSTILVRNK